MDRMLFSLPRELLHIGAGLLQALLDAFLQRV